MNLDTAEVRRISERLGALGNRHKLLASYIAVNAPDTELCSQMGLWRYQLPQALRELCTELHMTYLPDWTWRSYVREAVLLVASPDPPPPAPEAPKRYRISKKMWGEAEPLAASFVEAAKRTKDPVLAALFSQVPRVFAFALSLCNDVEYAQEMVQEGVARAYTNLPTFQPGSNLKTSLRSWLITIVNNFFLSDRRKRRREVADPDGIYEGTLECRPNQIDHLELMELQEALAELPVDQREAVLLLKDGYSYEEAAALLGCRVGTIKSRAFRGRTLLAKLLGAEAGDGSPAGNYLTHQSEKSETDAEIV